MERFLVWCGDAVDTLDSQPPGSVDLVLTDPIYPEVDRSYGRITVDAWKRLMARVCTAARRALAPRGSAVFVLQPNSAKVGSVRPWFFEFAAYVAREWNMPQAVYWWNFAAMPTIHCNREYGLMRESVKQCVWAGAPDCYRNQERVLWAPSDATLDRASSAQERSRVVSSPSGHHVRRGRIEETYKDRGGVTPFNLIPVANTASRGSAGAKGHGAGTPYEVVDFWVRYACPPGGRVCDPFCGSGTVPEAVLANGASFVGGDLDPASVAMTLETCRAEMERQAKTTPAAGML